MTARDKKRLTKLKGAKLKIESAAKSRATMAAAVFAEKKRCAALVPTNWLDSLLTGKDAPRMPLDSRGVETLLRGVQDRIRNS